MGSDNGLLNFHFTLILPLCECEECPSEVRNSGVKYKMEMK